MNHGVLGLVAVSLATLACSASMGRKIDEAKVNGIKQCETTEKELLEWFGEPSQRGNQNGMPSLQWMYARQDSGIGTAELQTQNLVVILNKQGKVVEYHLNPTSMPEAKDTCAAPASG